MNDSRSPSRGFGLLSLSSLVVANMIGAGVYTSSGYALAELGTTGRVLAAWGIAGGIAMLGAICYGGLARQLTESGGEYLFLSRAVHPLAGFMAGWVSLTAGFSGAIAYSAITFEAYLPAETWLGSREPGVVACALVGAFAVTHFAGLSAGARAQNLLVLVKLLLLVGFVVFGSTVIVSGGGDAAVAEAAPATAGAMPLAALATSVMWFSFSYAGYNAAVYVAGSSTGGVTVARSMWIATAAVTMLYLSLNAVILWGAPSGELAGQRDVLRIAAVHIGGPTLQQAVTGVILLSLATSVSAMVQAGPHVYAQMARDGALPAWLAPREGGVPRAAIVVQTVLAIGVVLATERLQQLLDYLAFLLSLSSAATVACLLLPRLAGRRGDRPVFLWPLTPILFITSSLVIAGLALRFRLQSDPDGVVAALWVLPLGLVAYWLLRRKGPPPF